MTWSSRDDDGSELFDQPTIPRASVAVSGNPARRAATAPGPLARHRAGSAAAHGTGAPPSLTRAPSEEIKAVLPIDDDPPVVAKGSGRHEAADAPPEPGRVLCHRYRLEQRIATGGFGTVFSAEDLRLSKRVAVKVLSSRVAQNRDHLIARFRREAVAASQIGHEGIVNVTDFDRDDDGTYFIVMELLEGVDLARTIQTGGAMPPERALSIAAQIANALECAHRCGVLHRDLKPANVFLTTRASRRDAVKVVDFGISKIVDERLAVGLTLNGQVVGTPYYMAPEQARGWRDLDGRVDVYALGVILFEMLVGRPPFTGVDHLSVVVQHLTYEVPWPSTQRPDLPTDLDELVRRAMAKDRDERYPSMATFGAALLAELNKIDPLQAALSGAALPGEERDAGDGSSLDAARPGLPRARRASVPLTDSRETMPSTTIGKAPPPPGAITLCGLPPVAACRSPEASAIYEGIEILDAFDALEDADTSVRRRVVADRSVAARVAAPAADRSPAPRRGRRLRRAAGIAIRIALAAAAASLVAGDAAPVDAPAAGPRTGWSWAPPAACPAEAVGEVPAADAPVD